MNLNALHTFLTIVDQGSLVKASRQLNVTQSTVTARLKTLEDELGQDLLIRQKTGVTLTPSGTRLLRYARVMDGLWRQARFETRLPDGLDAVCTFGCLPHLWHGPGRAFFEGARQARQAMALSVHQGSARELADWLSSGLVDVILTYGATARGSQNVHPLPAEELILCSPDPATPIRHSGSYIFVDYGPDYRRQHAETYHDAGVARVSFDQPEWALDYLLHAGGSAYLPRRLAAPYLLERRLFILTEAPSYRRSVSLVTNEATAQVWDWFETVLEDLRNSLMLTSEAAK